MIDSRKDLQAFSEAREALVARHGCKVEPPHPNLAYSPKPMTTFSKVVGGQTYYCDVFLEDSDTVTSEIAAYICRKLHMYPGSLIF